MGNVSLTPISGMPAGLASLPAFPSVATRLLSLLGDEDVRFSAVAACIASDPSLSARLIRRANAADQPGYCEIRDVMQAAVSLGLDRTREVTMAAATSVFAASAIRRETLRPCWHHTLACAMTASEIGRMCGLRPAESYTAGLLHDIGRLGLLQAYPAEYEKILAEAAGRPGDLSRLEREQFGVDHVEAGVWLAQRWNLPEWIVNIIGGRQGATAPALDLTVVQVACRLADLLGFGVVQPGEPLDFDEICAPLPDWVRQPLGAQFPRLQAAVDKEIKMLEGIEDPPPECAAPDAGAENEPAASTLADDFPDPLVALGTFLLMVAFLACAAVLFVPR